jgi:hypothetical protein
VRGLLKIGISLDGITKFSKKIGQNANCFPGTSFERVFVSQKDKNGH